MGRRKGLKIPRAASLCGFESRPRHQKDSKTCPRPVLASILISAGLSVGSRHLPLGPPYQHEGEGIDVSVLARPVRPKRDGLQAPQVTGGCTAIVRKQGRQIVSQLFGWCLRGHEPVDLTDKSIHKDDRGAPVILRKGSKSKGPSLRRCLPVPVSPCTQPVDHPG